MMSTSGSEHIAASEFRRWLASARAGDRLTCLSAFSENRLATAKTQISPRCCAASRDLWRAQPRVPRATPAGTQPVRLSR